MEKEKQMTAKELSQIMSNELRMLHEIDITDKFIAKKIDKAKQIFNGGGKLIALATLSIEAVRLGVQTDILDLTSKKEK